MGFFAHLLNSFGRTSGDRSHEWQNEPAEIDYGLIEYQLESDPVHQRELLDEMMERRETADYPKEADDPGGFEKPEVLLENDGISRLDGIELSSDPMLIVAGFNADRYSFFAIGRDKEAGPDGPLTFAIGLSSMEIVTIEELGAELSPWINLNVDQEKALAADRFAELQMGDREYRAEQALAKEPDRGRGD